MLNSLGVSCLEVFVSDQAETVAARRTLLKV